MLLEQPSRTQPLATVDIHRNRTGISMNITLVAIEITVLAVLVGTFVGASTGWI